MIMIWQALKMSIKGQRPWFEIFNGVPIGTEARLEVRGPTLLLIVCSNFSFLLSYLIANGYLFIYLCFLCLHLGTDKNILLKKF